MDVILYGSLTLSLLHALIPSHWLPFVTIGKTERWSLRQTLTVTAIAGLAHTVSTTLLGVLVSLAGWQLAENYHDLSERAIPLLLIALGLWYLMQHLRHRHVHDHIEAGKINRKRSFAALLFSLVAAMFLSPCLEIEAYFLSAGAKGWEAVGLVALIYNVITLSGMLLMVSLGRRGLQQVNPRWFEHYENLITGLTLVGLAVFNFFIDI
ncbi:hypothetical protein FAES_pFAES01131 (plasmid) [Fibrella aestuarina BUZ 2]|uniref:Urease accessory protein UreH-like transmembrane domain-containing protein n=1 Tax=Fibrella aestuarina BUZ 2 TaxID=1166018 RepID=I0KHL8_9BACT|nr:hypothetical protein [Fibrella aestuarina]CCH03621.1 hypothetical protein FAES_pFAES01131 [Fibrella aestuarina BUZ 2]